MDFAHFHHHGHRDLHAAADTPGGTRRVRLLCAAAALLALALCPTVLARTITVISGTYGQNCGAPQGNATADLAHHCDGRSSCEFMLGDASMSPRNAQCGADLVAEWRCTDTEWHMAALSAAAGPDDTLVLSCVVQTGPGR